MRRPRPPLFTRFVAATVALAESAAAAPASAGGSASGSSAARSDKSAAGTERPSAPAANREPTLTPESAFARATAFYESGQYVECADAFAALLDDEALAGGLAFRSREQARVYRAACLIAQGKTAAADEQFRAAIRESPQMAQPSPIVFPQPVIERFFVVQSALLQEIRRAEEERAEREREAAAKARERTLAERARVQRLERLASEETIVVKNRRWMAYVPFGTGQFQNRDYVLGALFLASEVALVGTAITATEIQLSLHSQANGGAGLSNSSRAPVEQLNQNIDTANRIALYSTGALALVVAGGILQANLAFVPEFTDGVRRRQPRPGDGAPPTIAPTVTPTVGGAELGLAGRF